MRGISASIWRLPQVLPSARLRRAARHFFLDYDLSLLAHFIEIAGAFASFFLSSFCNRPVAFSMISALIGRFFVKAPHSTRSQALQRCQLQCRSKIRQRRAPISNKHSPAFTSIEYAPRTASSARPLAHTIRTLAFPHHHQRASRGIRFKTVFRLVFSKDYVIELSIVAHFSCYRVL